MTTPTVTDFADHVEWLKREVAVPGTFASLFPSTTDDDLASALVDGFYRAKRDGWFPTIDADPDDLTATENLSMTAIGIVVLYTGCQFVANQIKDMNSVFRARDAAGDEFETQKAPSVLVERLKEMQQEKKDLLDLALNPSRRRPSVVMHDGYAIRLGNLYAPERLINMPIRVLAPAELT